MAYATNPEVFGTLAAMCQRALVANSPPVLAGTDSTPTAAP